MTDNDHVLRQLAEMKSRFPSMRLKRVRLFGSRAAGTARPDSDLDLLVDPEDGVTLFDLSDIKDTFEKSLNIKVDLVTPRGLHPALSARILAEAKDV